MLKTLCFFTFFILGRHFEILKVSFCTVWANSKLRKWYFVLAKRSFFITLGKKGLEIVLHQEIPCPYGLGASFFYQLCHKHAGSSSKIELVMEALCLHWKLRAHFQRFSLVPPLDLSFWAKAIGFHFFKLFGMCKRSNMYMEKKTLLQGMFV